MTAPKTIEVDSTQALANMAEKTILSAIHECVVQGGRCTLGLSGGSTPIPLYESLGKNAAIDWPKLTIFLVDERYTLPDHPESNQRMIRKTLLQSPDSKKAKILFPDTALPLEACIDSYDHMIAGLSPDLVILGMGDDGHIASLFPPVGKEAFGPATVMHTVTNRFAVHDRISVTLPFLKKAKQRIFLTTGQEKKALLEAMIAGPEDIGKYPAQALFDGRTTWIVGP